MAKILPGGKATGSEQREYCKSSTPSSVLVWPVCNVGAALHQKFALLLPQ